MIYLKDWSYEIFDQKKLHANCCTLDFTEALVLAGKKPLLFSEDLSYRHFKQVKSKKTREIFVCVHQDCKIRSFILSYFMGLHCAGVQVYVGA